MKMAVSLLMLSFTLTSQAIQFNISIWEKDNNCAQAICLPKTLVFDGPYEIAEPAINSFSQLRVPYQNFKIHFTLTKKDQFGGYYSFQTEVRDSDGRTIALCSRFESISTFEHTPVGACAGQNPLEDKLLGVSVYKINP